MSTLFFPFLLSSAMAFGAIVLSCFTLLHARSVARSAKKTAAAQKHAENLLETMAQRLNALASDLEQLRHQPPSVVLAGPPKPGFNLSKRTQALRMHRRGDSTEQIASALEIPRQEVDLLLKVHRIVISNL
jgi:hypothetical protein